MKNTINKERIHQRIEQISRVGRLSNGGVTRLALSKEDKKVRDLLGMWFEQAGLQLRVDKIGNMFGLLVVDNEKPFAGIGSHLDSVPSGGFYDGVLGVVAALETAERLQELNVHLPFNIAVCNFTNEEGARFTPGMMGSKAHADPSSLSSLLASTDENGVTVADALKAIGYDGNLEPGTLPIQKFLELHIEQGPRLEGTGADIGVVDRVQAIRWLELTIKGDANHAGTTPIDYRKDAFYALARLSVQLRKWCEQTDNLVITTGRLQLEPNAPNIIPGCVTCTFDIRHPRHQICDNVIENLNQFIKQENCFKGIETEIKPLTNVNDVAFDPTMVEAVERGAKAAGLSTQKMYSGAGHDAQLMAGCARTAMIFIPSKYGISHSEKEFSSCQQVENGCQAVLNTVLELIPKYS